MSRTCPALGSGDCRTLRSGSELAGVPLAGRGPILPTWACVRAAALRPGSPRFVLFVLLDTHLAHLALRPRPRESRDVVKRPVLPPARPWEPVWGPGVRGRPGDAGRTLRPARPSAGRSLHLPASGLPELALAGASVLGPRWCQGCCRASALPGPRVPLLDRSGTLRAVAPTGNRSQHTAGTSDGALRVQK